MSARRRVGLGQVVAGLGVLGVVFALGVFLGARWLGPPAPAPEAVGPHEAPVVARESPPEAPAEAAPPERPVAEPAVAPPPRRGEGSLIALVIDDLGRSIAELARLEALGVPLTYAVLPFEAMTPRVVAELGSRGVEILCHLPMEAANGGDPGPGALRADMALGELERRTAAALAAVPGAVGVNNHMGSELSSRSDAMRAILGVVAREGLFFLDSRTSADSVGYTTALSLGIPAAERHVFLDPEPYPEVVRREFDRLLELARQRGAAVAIGHPYPATLEVLEEAIPRARELGYQFVPVSYLLTRIDGVPD